VKEEGRRKKEEGRRKKEEGRRKKEEGRKIISNAPCPIPNSQFPNLKSKI